jgi:hypothetical protein
MNGLTISASVLLLAAAPLLAQQPVDAEDQAAKIVADCSARKFETSIEIDRGGEKRLTRFKLCAAKDSDDAAWVATLKDAKVKVEAHPDISLESKARLATQLDVEIAKYETASAATDPAPVTPPPAAEPAVETVSSLPAPATPPPVQTISSLPVPVVKPAAAKPRLTIRCLEPGEKGGGSSCSSLDRATRLSVQADADLNGAASLRFLRRGDLRSEMALAHMRQGESFRTKLPPELCAGVASTKVEIQVVGGKQVVDTLGPYNLRC